jgi:hypothetical protein
VKAEHRGISGQDECSDGMVEHDMHVKEYPPSQIPGSLNLGKIQEMIKAGVPSSK